MPRTRQKQRLGFSLVELMVVLVLVGTLVSLALPRFNTFIARGRQSEAHANLGIIATLQQSYKLEYNKYHDGLGMGMGHPRARCKPGEVRQKLNTLGFRVTDCESLRYTYATFAGDPSPNDYATSAAGNRDPHRFGNPGFQAEPWYIYPNCREGESWIISKDRKLGLETGKTDVIEKCT